MTLTRVRSQDPGTDFNNRMLLLKLIDPAVKIIWLTAIQTTDYSDYYHGDTVLNGPVKVAAIALALLVALLLLDMSFSLVSVGINAPGSGGPSEQGTAGDPTLVPGGSEQPGGSTSGSGPGSDPAGGSNPLSGTDGSVPAIPKEVLAPIGLWWWLLGNNGENLSPGSGLPGIDNATMPDGSGVSTPLVTATGIPPGTGIGDGTGTNPGPTAVGSSPTGKTPPGPGNGGIPSPGGTGQPSLPATPGNDTPSRVTGPDGSEIPDWMIPLLGGTKMIAGGNDGGAGATPDSSTPVRLPNGTVLTGSAELAETVTLITDYAMPITKGTVFDVSGTVTMTDGTPALGMIVEVYLARDKASPDRVKCGRTVAVDGRFVAKCEAPDSLAPGDYNLIARSFDNRLYHGSDSDPVVSLVSPTSLSIDAPGSVRSGEGCVVNVALTESVTGLPLAGQPVDVSIGSFSASGVTDDRGIVTVKSEPLPDGTLSIVATYPGQDGYLASTTQQDITVAPLDLLGLFLYGLLALVILLALAGIVFVAYSVWRRWRNQHDRLSCHEPPVEAEPVRMEACVPHPASPYVISFPAIDRLLPAVWGTGEELAVLVTGIPGKPVSLALDDKVLLDLTMGDGEAMVPLLLEKGSHRLSVMPATGGESLATAGIRIVDYREEVVRLFNDLYHRACLQFKAATERATPREFLWTVRRQMPDASDRHLDRVITIFEVANYSLHGIGRDDYVNSYLSIKELAL